MRKDTTAPPTTAPPTSPLAPRTTAEAAREWSGVYLALGDSLARGFGASVPKTKSYPALVAHALGEKIHLVSRAVPGQTTQDMIDAQLPEARAKLASGDVRLITLTVGANDLYRLPGCDRTRVALAARCAKSSQPPRRTSTRSCNHCSASTQRSPSLSTSTRTRFLARENRLERGTQIAYRQLDTMIADIAAKEHVLTADSRPAFAGRGGALTHALESPSGYHPNDAGYRVIAAAFLKALRYSTAQSG